MSHVGQNHPGLRTTDLETAKDTRLGDVPKTQNGHPEKTPSSFPVVRTCLLTLVPDSVPISSLGLPPHNCPSIATYPVPPGPLQPGLPLLESSQQGRAEEALLPEAVSSTQRQVWGQTSGLLEQMLCALSLLQLPSRLLPRVSPGHQPARLPSGSGEARRIIRGPPGTCSLYSFL